MGFVVGFLDGSVKVPSCGLGEVKARELKQFLPRAILNQPNAQANRRHIWSLIANQCRKPIEERVVLAATSTENNVAALNKGGYNFHEHNRANKPIHSARTVNIQERTTVESFANSPRRLHNPYNAVVGIFFS